MKPLYTYNVLKDKCVQCWFSKIVMSKETVVIPKVYLSFSTLACYPYQVEIRNLKSMLYLESNVIKTIII